MGWGGQGERETGRDRDIERERDKQAERGETREDTLAGLVCAGIY